MRLLLALACATALFSQGPQEARVPFQGKELVYLHSGPEPASEPRPVLVLLHPDAAGPIDIARETWKRWQPAAAAGRWRLVVPWTASAAPAWTDFGVKALEAILDDFRKRAGVDVSQVFLAGLGDGASQVFYAAARQPDLWTAALAVEGNPKLAIESNRLFGANTLSTPVLWIVGPESGTGAEALHRRLTASGYNVQLLANANPGVQQVFEWLGRQRRELAASKVDCETGSPAFARCYWLEITRFDPTLRNGVLGSTRVPPGSGAYLALGGFGFNTNVPGPGVVVAWLPENYSGPLKLNDRILSVGGRAIADPRDYVEFMDQVRDEKAVVILVQRDKGRTRLESRFVLPKREELQTARVQAEFLPDLRELQIVSRGAAGLRVNLPQSWLPLRLNWNGAGLGEVTDSPCRLLTSPASIRPCAQ